MGAFLSALGGAGNAASRYGEQIRGLLESRRHDFASLIAEEAVKERDPQTKALYLKTASGLADNKPMHDLLPPFVQHIQKRFEGNQAIAQALGGPPPEPKPQGTTPPFAALSPIKPVEAGGGGAPASNVAAPPSAAMPSTSPVQGGGAPAPTDSAPVIPPIGVAGPKPLRSFQDIYQQYNALPESITSGGWAGVQPVMEADLRETGAAQQARDILDYTLFQKRQGLERLKASPSWASIPDITKIQLEAEASGMSAPPMSAQLMLPHLISTGTLGEDAPPGTLESGTDQPVRKGVRYRVMYQPSTGAKEWQPIQAQTRAETDAQGNRILTNTQTGAKISDIEGGVAPTTVRPIVGMGENGPAITSAAEARGGVAPTLLPVTPAAMLGTQTSAGSYTDPEGHQTSQRTVQRVLPGGGRPTAARTPGPVGAPSQAGSTPVPPPSPMSPTVPAVLPKYEPTIRPLDPKNDVDSKVLAIARDQNNWKMATNVADKARITKRMAELGLQPGQISTSMRERANNARLILSHMDDLNKIIDQADKDGDLGVVATRWNSWLTNKLGKDDTKGQVFSKLSGMQGFLSTAVSMAHGGLRGGSSPTMVEHWETALDAKDPATLKAKLAQAKMWMEGYATLDNGLADTHQPGGLNMLPPSGGPKVIHWTRDAQGNPVQATQ